MVRRKNGPSEAYNGALAEPMYPLSLLDMCSEELVQQWVSERNTKTILLFKHYGIDPTTENCWRKLALALAKQHVPGFMPPPNEQGRPREHKEDDVTLMLLFHLLQWQGLSDRKASREIAKAGVVGQNSGTLLKRYQRMRRWKGGVWKGVFAWLDRLLIALRHMPVKTQSWNSLKSPPPIH